MTVTTEQPCRHGLTYLVSRMGAGDVAAFGRLYDRIGPLMFALSCHAIRRAPAGPPTANQAAHGRAAAEAATVRAFALMWQRAPSFDAASTGVVTWLLDCLRATRDLDGGALDAEPVGAVTSWRQPAAARVDGWSTGAAAPGVDGHASGSGAWPALAGRGARWPSAQQRGSRG